MFGCFIHLTICIKDKRDSRKEKHNILIYLNVFFWMVFYGTATQYRLYSAGECVVNVRVSVCAEYSGVVPPAPSSSGWILIPPSHWGRVAEFDGVTPFYTPRQWAYCIIPQPTGGNNDTTTKILNQSIVPVCMQCMYACLHVSRFVGVPNQLHSRAEGEFYEPPIPQGGMCMSVI